MNAHDILDMIGDAKGTYVWDAQQVRSGNIHSSDKKLFGKTAEFLPFQSI